MVGKIVCSKAGRDKGMFSVVVGNDGDRLLVCNGKSQPLSRPKRKNGKHLRFTNTRLSTEQISTDKSLRRALATYANRCNKEEE